MWVVVCGLLFGVCCSLLLLLLLLLLLSLLFSLLFIAGDPVGFMKR